MKKANMINLGKKIGLGSFLAMCMVSMAPSAFARGQILQQAGTAITSTPGEFIKVFTTFYNPRTGAKETVSQNCEFKSMPDVNIGVLDCIQEAPDAKGVSIEINSLVTDPTTNSTSTSTSTITR